MNSTLFEYFNTTNQTSPHFEKHLNFAKPITRERCERISFLEQNERCDYARKSESCRDRVFLLNYNSFFYCVCDYNDLSRVVCIILLLTELALVFWMIYLLTNHFLVPALTGISKMLNMNEYIAGLTIMTLGNNAPDIFGGILSYNLASRHVYSDAMAKNLFVCIFVSSIVMWVKPFAIDGNFFLRDVGFVLLYVTFVDFTIKICGGFVTLFWAIIMTLVFPFYIVVIFVDEYMQYRRLKEWRRSERRTVQELAHLESQNSPFSAHNANSTFELLDVYESPNKRLFRQFIVVFDTLDRHRFGSKWTICKLWALVKVPPLICLRLLIPQMNFNETSYSWSKLLCCVQLAISPSIICLTFLGSFLKLFDWSVPTFLMCLICFLPLSVFAFRHSRTDRIPKWYPYIAILTILSCTLVLYLVTAELIALMETVGIVLHCSHSYIGCTLFTWGNGWAELTTNVGMARKGFPRMAFSACFGVIILSTFTTICIPILYSIATTKQGEYYMSEGTIGESTSIILIVSLVTIILYGVTTNFMLRRSGGLLGITIYLLYLILTTSGEFELIHAFGTDHSLDRSQFDESYLTVH